MKNRGSTYPVSKAFCMVILSLSAKMDIKAQEKILIAENQQTQNQVILAIGQKLTYKTSAGGWITNVKIVGFTDSTILFTNPKKGDVTVQHKDFIALKIKRSKGREVAGTILIGAGAVGAFLGVVAAASPDNGGESDEIRGGFVLIGLVALPVLAGGIVLLHNKKVNLQKNWKLKLSSKSNAEESTTN